MIDINVRFGHTPRPRRLTDSLVVLEQQGNTFGLIVNYVQEVREIAPDEIEPIPYYGGEARTDVRFLAGLVKSGEQVTTILHLDSLLHLAQSVEEETNAWETLPFTDDAESGSFDTDAEDTNSIEDDAVFRERARNLAQQAGSQQDSQLFSLAVVRLGGELFGLELQTIREFAPTSRVTLVPCCPAHIVGQMNLRGDLVTLIDVARALGLPATSATATRKVVVVNDPELMVGILVEEVLDVVYLRTTDLLSEVATLSVQEKAYLRGTLLQNDRALKLLDLHTLLRQESLIVNEEP